MKKKGGVTRLLRQINDFRNALNNNSLMDLDTSNPNFTWNNKQKEPHRILECLNHYVANLEWKAFFPNYQIKNLDFFDSDTDRCSWIPTLKTSSKF